MSLQDLAFIESRIQCLERAIKSIDEQRVCQLRLQTNPQGSYNDGHCIENLKPELLADLRRHIEIQRDEMRTDLLNKILALKYASL